MPLDVYGSASSASKEGPLRHSFRSQWIGNTLQAKISAAVELNVRQNICQDTRYFAPPGVLSDAAHLSAAVDARDGLW